MESENNFSFAHEHGKGVELTVGLSRLRTLYIPTNRPYTGIPTSRVPFTESNRRNRPFQRVRLRPAVLVFTAFCMAALAGFTPLAPPVDPLPEADVGALFEQIQKGERIDLPKLYQALKGPQTTLRAYAAGDLGKYGDETSIPHLIDALSDESMHVGASYPKPGMNTTRYWANESLKILAKEDFGFVWDDPMEKRNEAISRWREWYLKKRT